MVWTLKPHGSWGEATTSAPASEMAAVLALPGSWPWFPASNTALVRKDQWGALLPQPAVTSIAPNTGPAAGGTACTVTGSALTGATGVSFGGVEGTAFSVTNATTLAVTSPPGADGPVTIDVHHPMGDVALANGFTYAG